MQNSEAGNSGHFSRLALSLQLAAFLWGSTSQWKPASSVVPAPTGWLPFDSPTPQILSGLPPNTPSFPNLARSYLTTWQDVCLSVWTLGRWCCPEASLVSREQALHLGVDNKLSRLLSSGLVGQVSQTDLFLTTYSHSGFMWE